MLREGGGKYCGPPSPSRPANTQQHLNNQIFGKSYLKQLSFKIYFLCYSSHDATILFFCCETNRGEKEMGGYSYEVICVTLIKVIKFNDARTAKKCLYFFLFW